MCSQRYLRAMIAEWAEVFVDQESSEAWQESCSPCLCTMLNGCSLCQMKLARFSAISTCLPNDADPPGADPVYDSKDVLDL